MLGEQLKRKVIDAESSRSYSFTSDEVHQINKACRQVFHYSFNTGCKKCIAEWINRLAVWFNNQA